MLESENTIKNKKNSFDRHTSRLDIAEERSLRNINIDFPK